MNRLYAIESTPTLTGAKADHRLRAARRRRSKRPRAALVGGAAGRLVLERERAEVPRRGRQGSAGAPRPLARRRRRLPARGGAPPRAPAEPVARQRRRRPSPTRRRSKSTRRTRRRRCASSRRRWTPARSICSSSSAQPGLHRAGGSQVPGAARQGPAVDLAHAATPTRRRVLLPLEPARGARPRELGRRARVRRHRHRDAAADRAALRRADDRGSARRVHRRADRQVARTIS